MTALADLLEHPPELCCLHLRGGMPWFVLLGHPVTLCADCMHLADIESDRCHACGRDLTDGTLTVRAEGTGVAFAWRCADCAPEAT